MKGSNHSYHIIKSNHISDTTVGLSILLRGVVLQRSLQACGGVGNPRVQVVVLFSFVQKMWFLDQTGRKDDGSPGFMYE